MKLVQALIVFRAYGKRIVIRLASKVGYLELIQLAGSQELSIEWFQRKRRSIFSHYVTAVGGLFLFMTLMEAAYFFIPDRVEMLLPNSRQLSPYSHQIHQVAATCYSGKRQDTEVGFWVGRGPQGGPHVFDRKVVPWGDFGLLDYDTQWFEITDQLIGEVKSQEYDGWRSATRLYVAVTSPRSGYDVDAPFTDKQNIFGSVITSQELRDGNWGSKDGSWVKTIGEKGPYIAAREDWRRHYAPRLLIEKVEGLNSNSEVHFSYRPGFNSRVVSIEMPQVSQYLGQYSFTQKYVLPVEINGVMHQCPVNIKVEFNRSPELPRGWEIKDVELEYLKKSAVKNFTLDALLGWVGGPLDIEPRIAASQVWREELSFRGSRLVRPIQNKNYADAHDFLLRTPVVNTKPALAIELAFLMLMPVMLSAVAALVPLLLGIRKDKRSCKRAFVSSSHLLLSYLTATFIFIELSWFLLTLLGKYELRILIYVLASLFFLRFLLFQFTLQISSCCGYEIDWSRRSYFIGLRKSSCWSTTHIRVLSLILFLVSCVMFILCQGFANVIVALLIVLGA